MNYVRRQCTLAEVTWSHPTQRTERAAARGLLSRGEITDGDMDGDAP
jgi:hypothetical protein